MNKSDGKGCLDMVKEKEERLLQLHEELARILETKELLVEDMYTEDTSYREMTDDDMRQLISDYADYAAVWPEAESLEKYLLNMVYIKNYHFNTVSLYVYLLDVFYNDLLGDEFGKYFHLSSGEGRSVTRIGSKTYPKEIEEFVSTLSSNEKWVRLTKR